MIPADYPGQNEKYIGRFLMGVVILEVIVLLFIIFGSFPVQAQETHPLKFFPIWEIRQCPQETYACYTFDQAKTILRTDLELQMRTVECEAAEKNVGELTKAVEKMQLAFESERNGSDILMARLADQQREYESLYADWQNAKKHTVWRYMPWIISAGLALTAGALVGGILIGGI